MLAGQCQTKQRRTRPDPGGVSFFVFSLNRAEFVLEDIADFP